MAWYSDEQYAMIQDSREKKSVAASAFKQRTHCGKGGTVKFPSDYMSAKELRAMNGECKSYRMNDPMSWDEFVQWPNEHKVSYIKRIREKFGVDDKHVAEMFGVACNIFLMYVKELGLDAKSDCDEGWERQKFYAWRTGARTDLVKEETTETTEPVKEPDLTKPMTWTEFKTLSNENKIAYIQGLRDQFNVPDSRIARMFCVAQSSFARIIGELNIGAGKGHAKGKTKSAWDKEGFQRWCEMKTEKSTDELFQNHVDNIEAAESDIREDLVEEAYTIENESEHTETKTQNPGPIAFTGNSLPVIPKSGSMTFENNFADDALQTIKTLLGNVRVNLSISWECAFDDSIAMKE